MVADWYTAHIIQSHGGLQWALFTMAAMLVFKLSCKLAMCYAGGQTLEKRQIAENRLVEILK